MKPLVPTLMILLAVVGWAGCAGKPPSQTAAGDEDFETFEILIDRGEHATINNHPVPIPAIGQHLKQLGADHNSRILLTITPNATEQMKRAAINSLGASGYREVTVLQATTARPR
jgi:biopolymer transport protein ExbD